jgi:hypothetical protein
MANSRWFRQVVPYSAAVAVVSLVAGCSEAGPLEVVPEKALGSTMATTASFGVVAGPATNADIPAQLATLCVNAPAGTFSFQVAATNGGSASITTVPSSNPSLDAMECVTVATTETPSGTQDIITVGYQAQAGFTLDGVRRFILSSGVPTAAPTMTAIAGPEAEYRYFNVNHPVVFIFDVLQHPPLMDGEGCTPGYWSNRGLGIGSWAAAGHGPGDLVSGVFGKSAAFRVGDMTLLQVLRGGGGSGAEGAARTLGRAAVAALLNASHPDVAYPWTPAEVVEAVNAAFETGARDTMLKLADDLDADNNLGCPI